LAVSTALIKSGSVMIKIRVRNCGKALMHTTG
jgi:hypothetical protein